MNNFELHEHAAELAETETAYSLARQLIIAKSGEPSENLQAASADCITEEWTKCILKPMVVEVRRPRSGETHVSTSEGVVPLLPSDLIMRGDDGEYPISRELLKTYSVLQ